MPDRPDSSRDLQWYENQWEKLLDILPTSNPEEVVDQVQDLQISALDEEAEALEEMGIADAENAKTVLQRTFDRLQRLRQDKQVLQRLQDTLDADSPDDLASSINQLRERVRTLEDRQQVLTEAGFDDPEHAVQAITSMKEQLDELYGEKEATERTLPDTDVDLNGDTFDQLQALMAREEKLQRELGVSSPDSVIEIVEGLTEQLEDVYQDRDADSSENSIFAPSPASSSETKQLEEEFGTSDPDAVLEMVDDLTDQLDVLYESRERLAELNLNGAGEAIEMVQNMQQQLDSLYQQQAQMSDHGINGVDHALSIIENMETQLCELYEERSQLEAKGAPLPDEVVSRLGALEEKLNALIQEKDLLRDKGDRVQNQFDELEDQIGTGDPDTVTDMIDDLEAQIESVSEETSSSQRDSPSSVDDPLLPEDTLAQLDDLDEEELNAVPAGLFGVDDDGTIRRVNENVLQWPDVEANDSDVVLEKNFFDDVAPATRNALFQGRFRDAVDADDMDERFFYTYVGKQDPSTNLMVHLYRHPNQSLNWIVFRTL